MNLPECDFRHKCADGGEDSCSQPSGHYGRHVCRSCLQFFGGGEALHSTPPQAEPPAGRTPVPADGPGAGGGYGKGVWPTTDGPGSGGGYEKGGPSPSDGPGLGGGYQKGSPPPSDSPGLGGGYQKGGPRIQDLTLKDLFERIYGPEKALALLSEIQKAYDAGARGPALKARADEIVGKYNVAEAITSDDVVNAAATAASVGTFIIAVG